MTKTKKYEIEELHIPSSWKPGEFNPFISAEKLDERCEIQAAFFNEIFATNEEVILVPVEIAGAVKYPNNLMKYINNPKRLDIAYVDVMSFKNEKRLKEMTINYSPKLPDVIKNKKIIIIDCMYDKGTTISTLLDTFSKSPFSPKSISIFTMINKHPFEQLKNKLSEFPLFYKLAPYFKVPSELWYRGYGLDNERCIDHIQAKIPIKNS